MKKLFLFFAVIFLALPMRAQVLDTIYWGHPNYLYYPEWIPLDSLVSAGGVLWPSYQFHETEGWFYTEPLSYNSANEAAAYGYVSKGVTVYGLAAVVHWDTASHYQGGEILDSSFTDCFEYLRLYKPVGVNQLNLLAEGTFHADSPSHIMKIPHAESIYGPGTVTADLQMQDRLVYEVMFDTPITISDSFYIGYTWYNSKRFMEGNSWKQTHWSILYGSVSNSYVHQSSEYGYHYYYFRNNVYNTWLHQPYAQFTTVFLIVANDTVEHVDSVETCRSPDYLALRSRTDYDMALDWRVMPYAEAYDAVVVPWRDDPSTGVIRTTTANNQSFIGYGLQQGIYYAAYVRTRCHHECDIHDTVYYSDWSQPLYFFLGDTEPTDSPYAGVSTLSETSVTLVPNPASDQATVTSSFGINGIEVYSLKGELMEHSSRDGATVANIDLQRYPAGSYIVRIRTPKGIVARRLEVVR